MVWKLEEPFDQLDNNARQLMTKPNLSMWKHALELVKWPMLLNDANFIETYPTWLKQRAALRFRWTISLDLKICRMITSAESIHVNYQA